MISDEQIKALAVARGFKLTNETGDDLKPYVYEFARDLLAFSASEIETLMRSTKGMSTHSIKDQYVQFNAGVNAALKVLRGGK